MITAVKTVFGKYSQFEGRANRSEYWYFVLFDYCILLILCAPMGWLTYRSILGYYGFWINMRIVLYIIAPVYSLLTFIPFLAVTSRRLHDTGRSFATFLFVFVPAIGWVILMVFLAEQGTVGSNIYGLAPLNTCYNSTPTTNGPNIPLTAPKVYVKVVCDRGALTGKSMSSSGSIIIGRSRNNCSFVFPEGTNGISRTHCCLNVVNGNVTLTDMGSTYGTFLSNGTKLLPNQPVKIGDNTSFYLADKNTRLTAYIEIR